MPTRPTESAKSVGPRAKALYDYTADEDNEICESGLLCSALTKVRLTRWRHYLAFNEGDEITEIQFDSDDWWSGSIKGSRGL
jgi:hypothetical protein